MRTFLVINKDIGSRIEILEIDIPIEIDSRVTVIDQGKKTRYIVSEIETEILKEGKNANIEKYIYLSQIPFN